MNRMSAVPSTVYSVVDAHYPLVKRIAGSMVRRYPRAVHYDDLVQAGVIGLIVARERYDEDQGASFETYAGIRIRGAILDAIREGDWTPRSLHRGKREITKAIGEIEAEVGRDARASEVAERLGLSLDEYHRLLGDIDLAYVEAMDADPTQAAYAVASPEDGPEKALEAAQRDEAITRALASLPEKERFVIESTYLGDRTLKDIGEELGVTESRVCQIRTQAEARLRARLALAGVGLDRAGYGPHQ